MLITLLRRIKHITPPCHMQEQVAHPKHRQCAVACLAVLVLLLVTASVYAELPAEPLSARELPAQPSPHWTWMNDSVFQHMADGKAYLIDGDSGRFLGMLSTGYGFNGVVLPRSGDLIYSPETYFSRGTRGTRTDVVMVYSHRNLTPLAEIPIPPKRSSQLALVPAAMLTDDDRFLLIYNFTPAQSVTVVDTKSRKFVGEIETAGCALVYPTGARSFFSICADGALLSVTLDERGRAASLSRSDPIFDVARDPVTEKGVRIGATWWFASFKGEMYPVESTAAGPKLGSKWWLTTPEQRAAGWRSGGLQHLAVHRATRRLYAVMHQGGPGTHKDPGKEIWTFDLSTRQRVQRIEAKNPVSSIALSQDAKPLLFACFIGRNALDVYDARSGQFLRSVAELGLTPTTLIAR